MDRFYGTKHFITDWMRIRYKGVGDQHLRNRPTKTAMGMTKTAARSNHHVKGDALSLLVHGTTSRVNRFYFKSRSTHVCKCCNQRVDKWVLHEKTRWKLLQLRKKYGR